MLKQARKPVWLEVTEKGKKVVVTRVATGMGSSRAKLPTFKPQFHRIQVS